MSFAYILITLADTYSMVIFVYVMMSWIPMSEGIIADIYRVLGKICNPFLDIFKRIIPPIGMIDVSPIVALLVLQFGVRFIARLIF